MLMMNAPGKLFLTLGRASLASSFELYEPT